MIIIRTLRRDIANYNREDDELDDAIEETGWKLVHGDVFRPPKNVNIHEYCRSKIIIIGLRQESLGLTV